MSGFFCSTIYLQQSNILKDHMVHYLHEISKIRKKRRDQKQISDDQNLWGGGDRKLMLTEQ